MEASQGLLMMSETDAPFEFYYHEKPKEEEFTGEIMVEWDGKPSGTRVQELALEDFLNRMINPHAEADQAAKEAAPRFKHLLQKLNELLQNPKAYKISDVNMPVYLIGKTPAGDYAGLKTLVVET